MTAHGCSFVARAHSDEGFTLLELMLSISVLMIVCGVVMKGVLDLAGVEAMVTNRTDMHSGVRNATELLTQEVGQAGLIALPGDTTVGADVAVDATTISIASSVTETDPGVDPTLGMFVGEKLLIAAGGTDSKEETVDVVSVSAGSVTTTPLKYPHSAGSVITAPGSFKAGVIPNTATDGSTGDTLKIFGDIDGNGRMVYVEYKCVIDETTHQGKLYRNTMPFTESTKPAAEVSSKILIDNILENPPNPTDGVKTPCFTYQNKTAEGDTYVVDVAITLTVETARADAHTGARQTETKALLNVSPRNVFNAWQLASLQLKNRLQVTPDSVTTLLAD